MGERIEAGQGLQDHAYRPLAAPRDHRNCRWYSSFCGIAVGRDSISERRPPHAVTISAKATKKAIRALLRFSSTPARESDYCARTARQFLVWRSARNKLTEMHSMRDSTPSKLMTSVLATSPLDNKILRVAEGACRWFGEFAVQPFFHFQQNPRLKLVGSLLRILFNPNWE